MIYSPISYFVADKLAVTRRLRIDFFLFEVIPARLEWAFITVRTVRAFSGLGTCSSSSSKSSPTEPAYSLCFPSLSRSSSTVLGSIELKLSFTKADEFPARSSFAVLTEGVRDDSGISMTKNEVILLPRKSPMFAFLTHYEHTLTPKVQIMISMDMTSVKREKKLSLPPKMVFRTEICFVDYSGLN